MAETKTVHAKVARANYTYRGQNIPVGWVVKMTETQFAATQRITPPYFVEATAAEVKAAGVILDLALVEPAPAANVEAATAEPQKPPKR